MITYDNFAELAKNYTTFLIDIYGVIHDGISPFEDALITVNKLKDSGKEVMFFTNSPRSSTLVKKQLLSLSSKLDNFKIISSGDFFLNILSNPVTYGLEFLTKKCFVITQDLDYSLMQNKAISLTNNIEEAGYILIIAHTDKAENLSKFDTILKKAFIRKLPCVCPNPDLVTNNGQKLMFTSGSFSKRYEQLGGEVYYMGKPEELFYKFALGEIDSKSKKSVLAIGDNLETDIKGAINFGIDSLLVKNGIYNNRDINKLILDNNIQPTYIVSKLSLHDKII